MRENCFRKLAIILLSFLFILLTIATPAKASSFYILQPTGGDVSGPEIAILVYHDPIPLERIMVYAQNSSTGEISQIGRALSLNGTVYQAWWNTLGYLNGMYSLTATAYYSSTNFVSTNPVYVKVSNPLPNPTPTPGSLTTPQNNPTPTPQVTAPTPAPTSRAYDEEGNITQRKLTDGTYRVAVPSPSTNLPVASVPTELSIPDLLGQSTLITALTFKEDLNKNTRLGKIEKRKRLDTNTNFLAFFGHTTALLPVRINVFSEEPIVMRTSADASGNWTYILENPLEPGQHKVFVEVGEESNIETAGPYFFSIARAQASAENPTGASLDLVDPNNVIWLYLAIASGLIVLGIICVLFIRWRKKEVFNQANPATN